MVGYASPPIERISLLILVYKYDDDSTFYTWRLEPSSFVQGSDL
jgi:hypothetical protein